MATPIPVFPAGVATGADLKIANNLVQTTLKVSATATDTILFVESIAGFVANCLVSIDKEIIAVASVSSGPNPTLTVAAGGRGFDGTAAAQHSARAKLSMFIDAWHHNALSAEIMAIEAALGPNLSNVGRVPFLIATDYVFPPQSPGGSLAPGANVITLSPVPKGVNGSDLNHWLYISGGTGTPEPVKITGGTAVAGAASGTVIVNCANAHSGPWTIQTATAGSTEAFNSATIPCMVVYPAGDFTWHGPLTIPPITTTSSHRYVLRGAGAKTSRINIAIDFPLTVAAVISASDDGTHKTDGPEITDLGYIFPQPFGSPIASYTHWPTWFSSGGIAGDWNGISGVRLRRLYIVGAWKGIQLYGGGQHLIEDVQMSAFRIGIDLNTSVDTTRIHAFHFWPFTDIATPTLADQQEFWNPSVTGLLAEGNANIVISDSFFISGVAMDLPGSNAMVTVTNTSFDTFGVIKMSYTGGTSISIDNAFFFQVQSAGSYQCSQPLLQIGDKGTNLSITNSQFARGAIAQPMITVAATTTYSPLFASIAFTGNTFVDNSNTATVPPLFQVAGGPYPLALTLSDNRISYGNDISYSNPMLSVGAGIVRLVFQGNQNVGLGSGTWIRVTDDVQHVISNNRISGFGTGIWTASFPTVMLAGVYETEAFSYPLPQGTVKLTGPVTFTDHPRSTVFVCNAAAGQVIINLPFASSMKGEVYTAVKTDASVNQVSFNVAGSDTINGVTGPLNITTQYTTVTIVSDGTAWFKI